MGVVGERVLGGGRGGGGGDGCGGVCGEEGGGRGGDEVGGVCGEEGGRGGDGGWERMLDTAFRFLFCKVALAFDKNIIPVSKMLALE